MQINVCDYGAVPDGVYNSTNAFQSAIDDCANKGGGTVLVPAGTYATDMISLRDNIELHFEQGSKIVSLLTPVPDPNAAKCPCPSCNPHRWLIGGKNLKNVAITGFGTIDGRPEINFWNKNDGLEHPLYGQRFWPLLHRPKGMIHFRECENVTIRDVMLIDPPCYVIWLLGCDNCEVSGVRIDADLRGPNDDGIDIDCCSNVKVANCDIVCGDDGIALKSDIHELGHDKPCENITITNCRMHTTSDGIRIGFEGDGAIRRVAVSNCVIHDTMIGISMMVAISPNDVRGIDIYKGPEITDILFENLVIDAFQTFNFQHPKCPPDCKDPIKGFMDRVFFRNITATATRGSFLGGAVESPLRHIEFSNVFMRFSGFMGTDFLEKVPDPYPLWTDLPFSGTPWPFYVRNAEHIVMKDVTVKFENAEGAWQREPVRRENATVLTERVEVIG
ncbi:MAG: right-handed parallel beta-helix repeat-containing protein [Victivallales bacterium]|nr:right-handed parallel beta-helix repeat-containing protein [Victivallales bacterium]